MWLQTSTQYALVKLIESWGRSLDSRRYIGAVLMIYQKHLAQ